MVSRNRTTRQVGASVERVEHCSGSGYDGGADPVQSVTFYRYYRAPSTNKNVYYTRELLSLTCICIHYLFDKI